MEDKKGIVQRLLDGLKMAVFEKGKLIYRINIPSFRRSRKAIEAQPKGERIRIGFIVQSPENWATIQSVWDAALADERIEPVALLVPEIETAYYLILKNVNWEKTYEFGKRTFGDQAIRTYDPETEKWLDLKTLRLNYMFFLCPFETYLPKEYRASAIRKYAKVCYVPYSFLVTAKPEIEQIEYNSHFIRNVSLIFCEKQASLDFVNNKYIETIRSGDQKALFRGYPKFDLVAKSTAGDSPLWPRQRNKETYRIIWTPRWTTDPVLGGSHFFDYKDSMISLAENDPTIDLVFRPHPLALKNYVSAGLMTEEEQQAYLERYTACPNANVDHTTEYYDTFFTSDCMVTDITSVMIDYLFTGNPIIYCPSPNDRYFFAPELHESLYKVNSFEEIVRTIEMLRSGNDPKKEMRQKVVEMLKPNGSSAAGILAEIKKDYQEAGRQA